MVEESVKPAWYAFKVFYNRTARVAAMAHEEQMESYLPMHTVEKVVRGVKIKRRQPAISSLIFIRSSEEQILRLQQRLRGEAMLYADRETKTPTAIPEREMQIFISVTSLDDAGLEYLGDISTEWTTGERVRVIDGPFKGAEGYIKRIKGNHRLIVAIEGIAAVATSYIPTAFLEKIEVS